MESAEAAGHSFGEMLATIVELALERKPAPPGVTPQPPLPDMTSA
jgi:hypothetical protein